MTPTRAQVAEDMRLRDAARALVDADYENIRADLRVSSVGERAKSRLIGGASEVYEEAIEVASDHKGALAAIVAALALWFARHPILEAVLGEDNR